MRNSIFEAIFHDECHEEVSRGGELQPCDKPAVALRRDPEEGSAYPVCAFHARGEGMLRLYEIRKALS